MPKLTITLAQINVALGDTQKNIRTLETAAEAAGQRKSHMLVLPELFSTGYDLANAKQHASELNKGIFADLSRVATQNKVAIVGSVLEKRGLEVANSAPFFAPNGRMMGIYRKLHLFRLMEEDRYLQPGPSIPVLDLPWGPTGIAICYDLRFPELFRRYTVDNRVGLIIVPAEWPLARIDHWRALLVARAIENQCYIVACNAVGETGDTVFGGHSMIVDPWGKIVVEGGQEPLTLTATIDLDRIAAVRKQIPVFDDLRFDIYGN